MIPKIIHYCWFGGNPLPELAQKCIASWKKFCPDYVIKLWNESNFDLNCCDYVKEAYTAKKWAFVTDYVRLYALVHEGGVYMDTDVEVIKPLDFFLQCKAFSGFEDIDKIPTGIMASEAKLPIFKCLLDAYDGRHFLKDSGELDLTTNVTAITNTMLVYGLKLDNAEQTVSDFTFYPKEVFCPKSYAFGLIETTANTYTIHHFSGSWLTEDELKLHKAYQWFQRKLGEKVGLNVAKTIMCPYRIYIKLNLIGFKNTIKLAQNKLQQK